MFDALLCLILILFTTTLVFNTIQITKLIYLLQIWISPERVGEKTGCLAFIGISRPYFAITNKTRVQSSKIRNKFKS